MNLKSTAAAALTASMALGVDAAYARPAATPSPEGVVLGVTGWTDNGYVRHAGETSWTNWGGKLKGAPAVIQRGNITHMVATNLATGRLIHRTNDTGWNQLTTSGPCSKPSVAGVPSAQGGVGDFWMSCVGNNGHAYIRKLDGALGGGPQEIVRLTDTGRPNGGGIFLSVSIAVRKSSDGDEVVLTGTSRQFVGEQNTHRDIFPSAGWSWTRMRDWYCGSDIATAIDYDTDIESNLCDTGEYGMIVWDVKRDGEMLGYYGVTGAAGNKIGLASLEGGDFVAGVEGVTDSIPRYRRLTGGVDGGRWTQLGGRSRGGVAVGQLL